MIPFHDRIPVLLGVEAFDRWLDEPLGPAPLKPAAESPLWEWIILIRLNGTGHGDHDPMIVEPVAAVG